MVGGFGNHQRSPVEEARLRGQKAASRALAEIANDAALDYAGLTLAERVKIFLDLIQRYRQAMLLRAFIELLNSSGVEYLIAGGFALAFHGLPLHFLGADVEALGAG